MIIAWNQTMLDAIQLTEDTLGLSTRTMAMVQAAMYDAVNAIDHFGSVFQVSVPAARKRKGHRRRRPHRRRRTTCCRA